jgi:hypothetical protein
MDLTKCNPLLRQYYEAKQQEILARVTGSSSSSNWKFILVVEEVL